MRALVEHLVVVGPWMIGLLQVESPVVLFIRVFSRKHTKRPNSTNLNLIRRGGFRAVKLSTGGGERTERRQNLNPVPEAHIRAVYVSPGT